MELGHLCCKTLEMILFFFFLTISTFSVKYSPKLSLLLLVGICFIFTAKRLAAYQEVESEEEDNGVKTATLVRRDSSGSHHSVKAVHRSQSTKTHRRTGSRAEAMKASILSKHTAFSSPVEKDITLDPKLLEKVNVFLKHCLALF